LSITVTVWQRNPHHRTEALELLLQASEEVAVVGVHAHLPELVVVRAVAFADVPLSHTKAQDQLRLRRKAT
jgi:hypothetical protein